MAKKQSKLSPTQKKIVTGVTIAIEVAMIIVCIVFSAFIIISSQKEAGELKDGVNLMPVQSDSMKGSQKDSFNQGDMLIVRKLDMESAADRAQIVKGSIITYKGWVNGESQYISHRVVEEPQREPDATGNIYYATQGDYEAEQNKDTVKSILAGDVVGIVTGKIGGMGKVVTFLKQPQAFFPLIVVPLVLLLIYNGFVIVKAAMDAKVLKLEKQKNAELEQATQAAVEEALRRLRAEQEAQRAADTGAPEDSAPPKA